MIKSININIKELVKSKLFIFSIALIVMSFTIPLRFVFVGDVDSAERSLYLSEIYRNNSIWLFDNFFVVLLVVIVLFALVDIILRRRIKVVGMKKKNIAVAMLIPLLFTSIYLNAYTVRTTGGERSKPIVNKVFIITFDGTRADVFWNSDHWITQHKEEGVWAEKFSCTYPTVTYPNHISIVTGTWPQIHRCELNPAYEKERRHLIFRAYRKPVVEDIFEIAEEYGIVTALFMAPQTLAAIMGGPDTYRGGYGSSLENMNEAIEFINLHKEEIESRGLLIFIHLVDSDDIMHEYSTDSDEYRHAIEKQGDLVGELIENITALGWADDSLVIVTADHGAIGYAHFNRFPSMVCDVPFWAWGGPIRNGSAIKGGRLIDIAVTVAFALGIPKPRKAVGVVLYRIFMEDILRDVKGITDLEGTIVSEYKKSIHRAYFECVKYILGFSIMLILVSITIYDVIRLRRILRSMADLGESKSRNT